MKIVIEIIPHRMHRYGGTVGDYWIDPDGTWQIRVSELSTWMRSFLIIVHELWELGLTVARGIHEEDIQAFDKAYEIERERGEHTLEEEAGDDKRACYRAEHFSATNVERQLCAELEDNWNDYSKEVESL